LSQQLKCADAHGRAVSAGAMATLVELLLGSTATTGAMVEATN
jgi:hypothetical protein